jgi:hypothetical protein
MKQGLQTLTHNYSYYKYSLYLCFCACASGLSKRSFHQTTKSPRISLAPANDPSDQPFESFSFIASLVARHFSIACSKDLVPTVLYMGSTRQSTHCSVVFLLPGIEYEYSHDLDFQISLQHAANLSTSGRQPAEACVQPAITAKT